MEKIKKRFTDDLKLSESWGNMKYLEVRKHSEWKLMQQPQAHAEKELLCRAW